jgi:hypothetical protein
LIGLYRVLLGRSAPKEGAVVVVDTRKKETTGKTKESDVTIRIL